MLDTIQWKFNVTVWLGTSGCTSKTANSKIKAKDARKGKLVQIHTTKSTFTTLVKSSPESKGFLQKLFMFDGLFFDDESIVGLSDAEGVQHFFRIL